MKLHDVIGSRTAAIGRAVTTCCWAEAQASGRPPISRSSRLSRSARQSDRRVPSASFRPTRRLRRFPSFAHCEISISCAAVSQKWNATAATNRIIASSPVTPMSNAIWTTTRWRTGSSRAAAGKRSSISRTTRRRSASRTVTGLYAFCPYRFEVRLFRADEITVGIKVASQFRSLNVYQLTEQLRVIEVFHNASPLQTCIN